jgi:hypothetical protein
MDLFHSHADVSEWISLKNTEFYWLHLAFVDHDGV